MYATLASLGRSFVAAGAALLVSVTFLTAATGPALVANPTSQVATLSA